MKIILTILVALAFSGTAYFVYNTKTQSQETSVYSVTFNDSLTQSTYYPPENIEIQNTGSTSITLSWQLPEKQVSLPKPAAPEYANLSGFRIYRDGFWLTDLSKESRRFSDSYLYPSESYSYQIATLTFDNKIEGILSHPIAKTISATELHTPIPYTKTSVTKYLAEGDSITLGQRAAKEQGWVDTVSKNLNNSFATQSINTGSSGAISSDILGRIESDISENSPDLITIAIGINDLVAASSKLGNYPLLLYQKNVEQIIQKSQPSPSRLVLLLNIYNFDCCINPLTDKNKLAIWNKALKGVAYANKVQIVDVASAMKTQGDLKLLDDPLHPNQQGHDIIAQAVINQIEKSVPSE